MLAVSFHFRVVVPMKDERVPGCDGQRLARRDGGQEAELVVEPREGNAVDTVAEWMARLPMGAASCSRDDARAV